jgi:hypothetical protein
MWRRPRSRADRRYVRVWQQIPELQRYNEDNGSAARPLKGPLLILAGDDDQSVNCANIREGVVRACKLGLSSSCTGRV